MTFLRRSKQLQERMNKVGNVISIQTHSASELAIGLLPSITVQVGQSEQGAAHELANQACLERANLSLMTTLADIDRAESGRNGAVLALFTPESLLILAVRGWVAA